MGICLRLRLEIMDRLASMWLIWKRRCLQAAPQWTFPARHPLRPRAAPP